MTLKYLIFYTINQRSEQLFSLKIYLISTAAQFDKHDQTVLFHLNKIVFAGESCRIRHQPKLSHKISIYSP